MATPRFGKITSTRLPELVADRIESLILESELRPDDKLPSEKEVAAQFGVSRTAVREAIKLLEQRGLLQPRNGLGAFVTVPGPGVVSSSLAVVYRMQGWTIDHLHEARSALEPTVASLAAQNATPEDIGRLDEAIRAMDESLDAPYQYMEADVEFHTALANATHNPLFPVMIRPLVGLIQDAGRAGFFQGNIRERHKNHSLLLEHVKRGDAGGAEATMRRHLIATRLAFDTVQDGQEQEPRPIAITHESRLSGSPIQAVRPEAVPTE